MTDAVRRMSRGKGEQFTGVIAPEEHLAKIREADARRKAAIEEAAAARDELGELFAQLIENDWDLKHAAGEIGISRQTAYEWADRILER